jgi:hypothetical protein
MKIEFIGPAVKAEDDGVLFLARVDGRSVQCHFTYEALEDIDPDSLQDDPLAQFESHQLKLLSIAEAKLLKGLAIGDRLGVYTNDLRLDE